MLEIRVKRFLEKELNDWSDFVYELEEYDESQIVVNIRNDIWEVEATMYFIVDDENELCLYMSGEYWQKIDLLNFNKFFWIELLAVR